MNEQIPPVEEIDELKQEAAEYFNLVNNLATPEKSTSMNHVLRNLVGRIDPNFYSILMAKDPEKGKISIADNIDYIKRYLALLEEFPEFRKKEESAGDGYFPELSKSNESSRDLIDKYEELLRNPVKSSVE
jgi:hypothetical protein